MKPPHFEQKLREAQARSTSWLCVGLDPDPARMPSLPELEGAAGIAVFCRAIIDATQEVACAYKPNLAFFLAHGAAGIEALKEVILRVPGDIPVLLDAKAGDIGNTQQMYGQAAFATLGVDAMTVSPYVGEDAVRPLLEEYAGVGLFVLARTSNPGAERFQDHPGDGLLLYENVVEAARGWALVYKRSTVGLVVGATYPGELKIIRAQAPELPFLIPGIGAQGGVLDAAVKYGPTGSGIGPLISASRAINYASRGEDYAEAAHAAALDLRDRINVLREDAV